MTEARDGGYNNREVPGAGTAPLPFQPPAARALPPARLHPAPGATTTSVPTAEHREARTTGRARRPRRGRRKAEAPLAAAAPRAAPQAAAAPRSPGGFENSPRGEGGWVAAGGTRRLQRIGHAKPSALAGHSPERHPAYLPDSPPLRTTESPAARGGSSPRGAPVVPAARPPSTAANGWGGPRARGGRAPNPYLRRRAAWPGSSAGARFPPQPASHRPAPARGLPTTAAAVS